jgi:hypothetical protein
VGAVFAVVIGSLLAALAVAPTARADTGNYDIGPHVRIDPQKLPALRGTVPPTTVRKQGIGSADTTYFSVHNANSQLCLGVNGANMNNGTTIVQSVCYGTSHPDQGWTGIASVNSNLAYHLYNQSNPNKCLGVQGGSTEQGKNLVIWDCYGTDHPDQFWAVYDASLLNPYDNGWVFINAGSGRFMGVLGSYTYHGAPVVQWDWLDHADQRWY